MKNSMNALLAAQRVVMICRLIVTFMLFWVLQTDLQYLVATSYFVLVLITTVLIYSVNKRQKKELTEALAKTGLGPNPLNLKGAQERFCDTVKKEVQSVEK